MPFRCFLQHLDLKAALIGRAKPRSLFDLFNLLDKQFVRSAVTCSRVTAGIVDTTDPARRVSHYLSLRSLRDALAGAHLHQGKAPRDLSERAALYHRWVQRALHEELVDMVNLLEGDPWNAISKDMLIARRVDHRAISAHVLSGFLDATRGIERKKLKEELDVAGQVLARNLRINFEKVCAIKASEAALTPFDHAQHPELAHALTAQLVSVEATWPHVYSHVPLEIRQPSYVPVE